MTATTLSRVTLQTLENYRTAATQALTATRLGGHRLVRVVNGALASDVVARATRLAPRTKRRFDAARDSVSQIVAQAIDRVARGTERAVEVGSTVAAEQVGKVSRLTAGVANPVVASGLETAARITLPYARVALTLSGKVAEGAQALATAAGARPPRRAAAGRPHAAAKPVRRARQAPKAAAPKAKAPATRARRGAKAKAAAAA